jgi:hypothetical protein
VFDKDVIARTKLIPSVLLSRAVLMTADTLNCRCWPSPAAGGWTVRLFILLAALFLISDGAWADSKFDHFSTGFELDGAHANVTCESCHVGGRFLSTNSACSACHSGSGSVTASAKPFDHVITIGECSECHNTFSWLPAMFDHAGVTGNCASCHDGVAATGKHLTHINTTTVCEDCHNSSLWAPADTVDHTQVLGACGSCHDGVTATGKHPTHINTTAVCEDCHNTLIWAPVTMVDHAQVLGTCSSCHDGATAMGKNPGHFITLRQCDSCHDTFAWFPHNFMHMSLPYEPLDHASNPLCTTCHQANSEVVIWSFPTYQPDCAGCHASDFKPDPHKKYENPDVRYTVSELRDCTGSCHVYTDGTMTRIKESRPGPEHRISDGSF